MAYHAAVGSFVRQAGTGNQTVTGIVDANGNAFTGNVMYLWGTYQTAVGVTDEFIFHYGFDCLGGIDVGFFGRTGDNLSTTDVRRGHKDGMVVFVESSSGTNIAEASVVSYGSGEFTLDWVTNDGVQSIINYVVLGASGDDTLDAFSETADVGAGEDPGEDHVEFFGINFVPKALILVNAMTAIFADSDEFLSYPNQGWATAVSEQAHSCIVAQDAAADSNSFSYQRTDHVLVTLRTGAGGSTVGDTTTGSTAVFESFNDPPGEGWTINWDGPAVPAAMYYLIMGGGAGIAFKAGTLTQPATTGTQEVTLPGAPIAVLFQTIGQPASSSNYNGAQFAFGASNGVTNRSAVAADKDNEPTSINARAIRSDCAIEVISPAATGSSSTTVAKAAVSDFDADGFTLDWTVCDGTQREILYLAIYSPDAVQQDEVEFDESTIGLTWLEWTGGDDVTRAYAKVALPDAAAYYAGWKEGRTVRWGRVRRALSDRRGHYEGVHYSALLSDTDRSIRARLEAPTTRHFLNNVYVERMISDEDRRLELTPRTVARGIIRSYAARPNLLFEITGQDPLSVRFASSNEADQVPKRVITRADFEAAPEEVLNKPVQIIYGAVTDQNQHTLDVPGDPGTSASVGLRKPTNLTATVVGSAGTATHQYGVTALDDRYSRHERTRLNHEGETDAATVTVTNAPSTSQMSASRYVQLDWDDVPNALYYRIYGRNENVAAHELNLLDSANAARSGGEERYNDGERNGDEEVDIEKTDSHPPLTNQTVVSGDPGTPSSQIVVDTGRGQVPVVYTGLRSVGGTDKHEWLVAGHACKAITGWYLDGQRQADTTAGSSGPWIIPGFQRWTDTFGAATYRDFNGHRYTVIYRDTDTVGNQIAEGEVKLTLNVQGIESVGDGTGTLITDLFDQYYHCVTNWILGDYGSGAWLAVPTFADDDTLPLLDEDSFTAAQEIADARVAGGYVGAGIIGFDGQRTTARELLARWNISGDVDGGFNRKCQYMISMVPDSVLALTSGTGITDKRDIISESFEIVDDVDSLYTTLHLEFSRDYAKHLASGSWADSQTFRDADTIDSLDGEEKEAPARQLYFVRDHGVASDGARRWLERHLEVPRRVRWREPLRGLSTELGDILPVTSFQGIGETGWNENPVRVVRHEVDPDQMLVEIEAMDVGRYVTYLQTRGAANVPSQAPSLPGGVDAVIIGNQFGLATEPPLFGVLLQDPNALA